MNDYSRRQLLRDGLVAGVSATAVNALLGLPSLAGPSRTSAGDITILNAALDLEHQGIWAYGAAAPKLSQSKVGKTVLALALRNQDDHKKHRDLLASTITKLGGKPVEARKSYDLSTYIKAGEGNLDSDANIAKLALALEVDAALAYNDAFGKLKNVGLISAAASIGANESAHATAIRSVFHSLEASIEAVPAAFLDSNTRSKWVLQV